MSAAAQNLLRALGSLKFTPVGLLALAATTVGIYKFDHAAAPWIALPLFALALNLIAAVATNGAFRKQMALLVFHLALIVLVLLAAFGRLSYLKGEAEVLQGNAFNGLERRDAGPLHWGDLERVQFVNEGFEIVYVGGAMDRNVNRLRVLDADGRAQRVQIESNQPLVRAGYRIYPTSNKGFAPVFTWHRPGTAPMQAAVHLPSYPAQEANQSNSWRPPGARDDVWVLLDLDESLIPEDADSQFRLPDLQKVVVRHGELRAELLPGQRVTLPDGVLEFHELRTWMGYRFFYDWTLPWMLAACAVGALALSWFYWRKFSAVPWDRGLQ